MYLIHIFSPVRVVCSPPSVIVVCFLAYIAIWIYEIIALAATMIFFSFFLHAFFPIFEQHCNIRMRKKESDSSYSQFRLLQKWYETLYELWSSSERARENVRGKNIWKIHKYSSASSLCFFLFYFKCRRTVPLADCSFLMMMKTEEHKKNSTEKYIAISRTVKRTLHMHMRWVQLCSLWNGIWTIADFEYSMHTVEAASHEQRKKRADIINMNCIIIRLHKSSLICIFSVYYYCHWSWWWGPAQGEKFSPPQNFFQFSQFKKNGNLAWTEAAAAAAANNNDIAYCESLNVICRFSRAEAAQKVVESSSWRSRANADVTIKCV